MEEMHTAEEIAKMLRVSPKTVYRLIERGEIVAHKIGGQFRVSDSDLQDFLIKSRIPTKDVE